MALFTSRQEDGFVPVDPGDQLSKHEDLGLRVMRQAPEGGYLPRLEIRDDRRWTFFYCRIGSFYGKGAVMKPRFRSPQEAREAATTILIYLAVDGGRDTQGE